MKDEKILNEIRSIRLLLATLVHDRLWCVMCLAEDQRVPGITIFDGFVVCGEHHDALNKESIDVDA